MDKWQIRQSNQWSKNVPMKLFPIRNWRCLHWSLTKSIMNRLGRLKRILEFMDGVRRRLHVNHQRVQLMTLELVEYTISVSINKEVFNELDQPSFLKLIYGNMINSLFSEVIWKGPEQLEKVGVVFGQVEESIRVSEHPRTHPQKPNIVFSRTEVWIQIRKLAEVSWKEWSTNKTTRSKIWAKT